ncbi:MAG: hypothetical protein JW955_04460, partial [Sedimentisphaerales bacterium]|nr:hypothetical protein [Sedimentisphaerales bacterium]
MCRKCVLFTCSVFVLGMVLTEAVQAQDPNLVGWWKLDDGQGTTAVDSSGKGVNGTVHNPNGGLGLGGSVWDVDPERGVVASFNGDDTAGAYIEAGSIPKMTLDNDFTWAFWSNQTNSGGGVNETMLGNRYGGTASPLQFIKFTPTKFEYFNDDTTYSTSITYATPLPNNEWVHNVGVKKGKTLTYYRNGAKMGQSTTVSKTIDANPFFIGGDSQGERWSGRLSDVRLYNRALSDAEVKRMSARPKARNPNPADGATGVATSLLSWTAGTYAQWHEIYVGLTPDLTKADFKGRRSLVPAMYYAMPPLEPGQTYYWRIDEVEPNQAVHVGDVWSFTMAPVTAFAPIPADGALYQNVDADLTWSAGQDAFSHEVYFSTSQDDVANRAEAAFQGSLIGATLELPPLAMETTYYWCVDEIDSLGDKQAGSVWSFTTTIPGLGAAKRELWLNGSTGTTVADLTNDARYPGNPSDVNEMPDFESPANIADNYGGKLSAWLHVPLAGEYTFWVASDDNSQLWLGADADSAEMIASVPDWTNVQEWDKFPSQKSKPIALQAGRYFLMALWKDGTGGDNCAAAWQGAGVPNRELIAGNYLMPFEALWAYGPRPRNGAVDTTQVLELKWTAGTKATAHQIYFSDDPNAVADGTAYRGQQPLDNTSFNPGTLEFGKTYYWRVDEINPAEADSPWKGAVWSFTTANFIVVDDFEDYVDDVEGRIFQTWIDGWGYTEPAPGNPGNGTGSAVGYGSAPFAERTIVKSGLQSMPLAYNNADSPFYSETNRTFDTQMNWTVNGMDTLSLQVRGYPQLTTTAVTETGGKMTLTGDGADIWNNSDEFTYAYKSLNGDGSIVARVVSIGAGSNTWAKGGVMIRDSLDGGSMHAMMVMTANTDGAAGNGASFQYRNATDGTSGNSDSTAVVAPPYWVKLERFGDSFAGYVSADGSAWINVGTQDVVMTAPVYVGICVTSHAAGEQRTFQFESIKTTGSVTGAWQGAVIASPKYNSAQDLYVVVTDSANKSATVTNATAVNAADWTEALMPLSSFTGVNM